MILVAYGTRPEIIKLFPLIRQLKKQGLPFKTLFTGQHLDLYQDVKDLIPHPDYKLNNIHESTSSLAESFCRICSLVEKVISKENFRLIIIQGDTTTACAIAQIAFYHQIKIGHIEAGLRTYDLSNPYPEEANRRVISLLANYNFAPTKRAYQDLKKEGVEKVFLTGNTIVDALDSFEYEIKFDNIVLITIHRRENHKKLERIFNEINRAASKYPEINFIFPIHPNPKIQKFKNMLKGDNLNVIEPIEYQKMLGYISRAMCIISDSGGLQEEAVYFGKRILVVRKVTERPETIDAGFGKLVDLNIVEHMDWGLNRSNPPGINPFGDGKSSIRISEIIKKELYDL
jgi:UDP-N-acetylglucosamine 2-epimerase (non-hydrolysing)